MSSPTQASSSGAVELVGVVGVDSASVVLVPPPEPTTLPM